MFFNNYFFLFYVSFILVILMHQLNLNKNIEILPWQLAQVSFFKSIFYFIFSVLFSLSGMTLFWSPVMVCMRNRFIHVQTLKDFPQRNSTPVFISNISSAGVCLGLVTDHSVKAELLWLLICFYCVYCILGFQYNKRIIL